jgi:hypothetical protein
MKKLFTIFFISLLASQIVWGQIPNSGFEDWIESNGHLNPAGWWCANDSVQLGAAFPANRTSDHYPPNSGSYALRIENHLELLPSWSAFGIVWTGGLAGNDNPAFALQGHPVELYGYYKFLPLNGDTFEIHIRLYYEGIDVGGGQFKTAEMVNSWQPFSLDISDYETADSARVMILSCYNNDAPNPAGNSTLFIDNLSFDSLIVDGTDRLDATPHLTVYPNPATDYVSISGERLTRTAVYTITDIQGRAYLRIESPKPNEKVNIGFLSPGFYCIRFQSGDEFSRGFFVKH